jgi:hypothetical protein
MGSLYFSLVGQSTWHALGQPPETPTRILAISPEAVHVQTVRGRVYAFRDQAWSVLRGGEPKGEWSSQLPDVNQWGMEDCSRQVLPQAGRLPQVIKDSLTCWAWLEKSRLGFTYALLADGSVWRWNTPNDVDLWYAPLCLSALGALAGLALGVALFRSLQMVKMKAASVR